MHACIIPVPPPPAPNNSTQPLTISTHHTIQVLPLIQRCFSREEMARLVGTILGERPGDLMDTILAMMFRCVFFLSLRF